MPSRSSWLSPKTACLGVACLAALGAVLPDFTYPYWKANPLQPTFDVDYQIDRVRQRLTPVLDSVPPEGVVGLVDIDPMMRQPPGLAVARYVLRPRALAPLTGRRQPEWALGVFWTDYDPGAAPPRADGYELVDRIEAGIFLFHRTPPRTR